MHDILILLGLKLLSSKMRHLFFFIMVRKDQLVYIKVCFSKYSLPRTFLLVKDVTSTWMTPPPFFPIKISLLFFFFFFTKLLISCQKQLSFTLMSSQSYYLHNCHITSILYVTLKNIFFYVTVKFLFE